MCDSKHWNSLEICKIAVSVLTPLLLLWLGFLVNDSTNKAERAIKEIEQAKEEKMTKQLAVQNLSKSILERWASALVLVKSIEENSSPNELARSKSQYDEAHYSWLKDHQSHLLLVRGVIGEHQYSDFEEFIEYYLVGKSFAPLDRCLNIAYSQELKSPQGGKDSFGKCKIHALLRVTRNCGSAIVDELYMSTTQGKSYSKQTATEKLIKSCPD